MYRLANFITSIPDNLKSIVKDIDITKSKIYINLGIKYFNQRVIETIYSDFSKFKSNLKKSLKEKGIEKEDIPQIISLIENNHTKIYPDNENAAFDDDVCTDKGEGKKDELHVSKPDISFEEWQTKLFEKYTIIKNVCNKNFPGIWHSVEFELAVLKILNIEGCTLPFAGIILGPPSSSKTLGIELFRNYKNVYYSDSFTPKAFVSHSTSVSKEALPEIDMLPKIKDKCFLAPELAPIFSKKDDEVTDLLGILTRILDGHGFESDSGAHGRRGYSGEYMFTMVGAAVNIPYRVYSRLSNLGPKLFFLRMPRSNKKDVDYIRMLNDDDFNEKKQELQEVINEYLNWFDKSCPIEQGNNNNRLLKIHFESKNKEGEHDNILIIIVKLGKLLARLRGTVNVWNTEKTQGSNYGYSTPTIEEPDRAMTQLLNLAKGHALSQGRNYLTLEDIPLLIKVVLSTATIERVMVFDLLLAYNGTMTTSQLKKSLEIAKATALKTMLELNILGLVSCNHFDTYDEDEYDNSHLTSIHDRSSNNEKR